jgi:hypothetical protein
VTTWTYRPGSSIFRYRDRRQVERWMYPDDAAAWNAIFTA